MDEQLNCNANIVSSYPLQNSNEQDISIFKINNLTYENKKLSNNNNINNNNNSETTNLTTASSSFITSQSATLNNSNNKNNLITNNLYINKETDMSSSSTVASSSDLFSSNCAQQAYFQQQQQQLALAIQKNSAVLPSETTNFNNGYQQYQMNYSLTNGSAHLMQSQVNDILNNNNNNNNNNSNNNMSQSVSDSPVKASRKVNGSSTPIKKKKPEVYTFDELFSLYI